MPYVERDSGTHAVKGLYGREQPGYAEEWLEDGDAEVVAFRIPPTAPPHLNYGGLVRFAGTAPVSVYENIRLGAVTRVSKGRWRTNLVESIPDGFSPIVSYIDAAVRNVRVSAITANYVEVKAVDAAGAAADCQQVIVKIERVIS
jgi:hypothetical protein